MHTLSTNMYMGSPLFSESVYFANIMEYLFLGLWPFVMFYAWDCLNDQDSH